MSSTSHLSARGHAWRYKSLRDIGFRSDPWLWVFALIGAVVIATTSGIEIGWQHVANLLVYFISSCLLAWAFGLIGSYLSWRWFGRSRDAVLSGALLAVVLLTVWLMPVQSRMRDYQNIRIERIESAAETARASLAPRGQLPPIIDRKELAKSQERIKSTNQPCMPPVFAGVGTAIGYIGDIIEAAAGDDLGLRFQQKMIEMYWFHAAPSPLFWNATSARDDAELRDPDVNWGLTMALWAEFERRGLEVPLRSALRELYRTAEGAAARGDVEAMLYLANRYDRAWGVPMDPDEAARWFLRAAEHGDGGAMGRLGWMYVMGRGVLKDDREALRWFRGAAQQGDLEAMFLVGGVYEEGLGVVQDNIESYAWFSVATAFGYDTARSYRDTVAARLTPDARLTAQRRARVLYDQINAQSD